VITHFIPLFRYYVSGSDESGWSHVVGESTSPTRSVFSRLIFAQWSAVLHLLKPSGNFTYNQV
jgi:hypothetical protein